MRRRRNRNEKTKWQETEVGIEKELVDWAQRKEWYILNGSKGDWDGNILLGG